jgi:aryl-alcohol dehydrogenase-like predicted oxidoreductase
MKRRTLGIGGHSLDVSALGLGCMGMSYAYGSADESRCIETLHHALDIGVTFLDTADIYGPEANERLLARVLGERRRDIELATKFGFAWDNPDRTVGARPAHVHQACDASLQRLGVDHIDLYYLHRVDPDVAIEETVGAMSDLVAAGKVRHIGLSEAAPATLRRAHATHPLTALQSEYSLWSRDVEADVLPTLRELGVGLVPYSPLGRGFLTGHIQSPTDMESTDVRRTQQPRFQADNLARNRRMVERLETMAGERGVTAAQIALAWLLHQGDDLVPIPATTRPDRVDENAQALAIELTPQETRRLEETFPPGAAAGERYGEAGMQLIRG